MNNKETDFHFSSQTPIAIKFDAESEFTAKFDTGTGGTFYGGGGSHSSMTPTLTRIGGANADPSMTITHGSSYSEFKLQFSGSATWMFIGTVYGHDNDKSNNQFY